MNGFEFSPTLIGRPRRGSVKWMPVYPGSVSSAGFPLSSSVKTVPSVAANFAIVFSYFELAENASKGVISGWH